MDKKMHDKGLEVRKAVLGEAYVNNALKNVDDFNRPFPADRVRLTSIYSKEDGVVRWQAALIPDGDCVEVTGSHVGLVFNRKTYRAIATALALPELTSGGTPC